MPDSSFDTLVLGGGPGGYVAAIRAAQLGMKTAVVEREHLGGICLNWGCIPTKALLRSSEINHLLHHLDAYGFAAKDITYDTKKVVERSRKVAKQLSNGVGYLMKKHKITVIDGQAALLGKGKVAVAKDGKSLGEFSAKNIILATGARARSLPGLEPDGKLVWTYKEAMIPSSDAEIAARRRLGRHRHRVRELLPRHGRPRSRSSKCSTASCRSRTRRSPPSRASPSRSRA